MTTPRLQQLLKFHEADPTDAFCAYGIALEYAKAGQLENALNWLDKTIACDANYAYAHYQKAKLLFESGRIDEARAAIDAGLAAAQRGGDAHAASELTTLGESF